MMKFFRDESGQSTTEYILILAVVVMIALKFKGAIGEKIEKATDDLGSKITEGLNDTLN